MLHIILGILKIIGIIIGIILLLLFAVILAVLFSPVRYRLQAVKEAGRLGGEVRLSWLLHIVSVAVSFHADSGGAVSIRLFGIQLPFFGKSGKESGTAKKKKKRGTVRKQPKKEKEVIEPRMPEAIEPPESLKEVQENPELSESPEEKQESPKTPKKPEEKQESPKTPERPEEVQEGPEPSEMPGRQEWQTEDEKENPGIKFFCKIRFKIRAIYDRIKRVLHVLQAILQGLASIPEKVGHIFEKIREILEKPGRMLELAEEYEVREVLGGLLKQAKYLLRHYGPRRISGYVRFGTGDPALTGQLAGLIYLLLPAKADQFTVTPEFDGMVFETEVLCSGHIRACHVLRVVWTAFRDKKLRRLIRLVRKKSA